MKTISNDGLARRYATAQKPVWLLTLASGDWTWRGATRQVVMDGETWPARLAGIDRWEESMIEGAAPGGRTRACADVSVGDLPDSSDSLHDRLAVKPPIGIEATLRLAWLGAGDLSVDDAAVMVRGRLSAWEIRPAGVCLTITDELEIQGERRVGRLLRSEMLNGATSPLLGQTLPWIFGRLEDAPLAELRVGVTAKLAQAIEAETTVLTMVSLTGFTPQGFVQIGEEIIEYIAVDSEAGTLGTAEHPVSRGASPVAHNRGTTVRLIPGGGLQWLVADHAVKSVETVFADGVELDPADWTTSILDLGEHQAQIVTMDSWPIDAEGREADRISATVEGWADDQDALIENPADVIEWLLTHARAGSLDAQRIDATSFGAARDELDARGYRFARRLRGDETLGDLIDAASREAGVWIGGGDPIQLILTDPIPHPARGEEDLDDTKALIAARPADVSAPTGYIPPDAVELVGAPLTQGRGRPSFQFPAESEDGGAIPRRFRIDWLDLAEVDAAGDLGDLYWSHLSEPPFVYRQSFPVGAGLLCAGETVRLTDAPLDLNEALAGVVKAELDGTLSRTRLTLRGPWAGGYCWKQDLDHFIRRYAFGGMLVIVVDGSPVARLTRDGNLRLTGRLREEASFSAGPFATPVAMNGGWLYLCVGSAGSYDPFARIDADGNMELTGAFREKSALEIDPQGEAMGATADRFWFSTDTLAGALEWQEGDGVLHLKGILTESVRL